MISDGWVILCNPEAAGHVAHVCLSRSQLSLERQNIGVGEACALSDESANLSADVATDVGGPLDRRPNLLDDQEVRPHRPPLPHPIEIQAGERTITAADPLPDDLHAAL